MLASNELLARLVDKRNGIMIEAVYQLQSDGRYKNVRWRLFTVPSNSWGDWHKIHGNQKKSINIALPLYCYAVPNETPELTAEEIERATQRYKRDYHACGIA